MSNAGNFLITSEYPTDKIVWLYEGTTMTDAYGSFDVIIPHSLHATIFCTGIWTIDDWSSQYNTSTAVHLGQTYLRYSNISSNDTRVEFSGFCMKDESTALAGATVKYRLWGFFNEASTLDIFASETAGASDNNFIKDSRLGYPKLFMEGFADATQGTQIVYHNLGFYPYVELWQLLGNDWYQVDYIDFPSASTTWTVRMTTQTISFNGEGYSNYKYYYRIYADE